MKTKTVKKILKIIRDNKTFMVTSHQNLEGDAIGSQLALAELLELMGKEVLLLSPEQIPATYRFIPATKKMKYMIDSQAFEYDVACVLDCTDIDRMGYVKKFLSPGKPLFNIDHHVSNTNFGTINWIEPKLSSSGEQVYHLFKEAGVPINKKVAFFIYIAILTDTGSFRYLNTNARTHEIVAELIKKGLNPTRIYRRIYEEAHRSRLDLLSSALSTLDISGDGKIAWLRITDDMLKRYKTNIEGTEDFVNFPRSIKGIKIAIAFREIGKDVIKVSLRSNEGIDVCKLAKTFGGGGHPSASGCIIKGSMPEVEEAVLLKARELVR